MLLQGSTVIALAGCQLKTSVLSRGDERVAAFKGFGALIEMRQERNDYAMKSIPECSLKDYKVREKERRWPTANSKKM